MTDEKSSKENVLLESLEGKDLSTADARKKLAREFAKKLTPAVIEHVNRLRAEAGKPPIE